MARFVNTPVRIAVFPVAGLGTRILPATKAIPKEMLPVVNRPLVEYAVDEARAAGIKQFVFVVAPGKSLVTDHFSINKQLEEVLQAKGKTEALNLVRNSNLKPGSVKQALQKKPLGLGHAVLSARECVGAQPFAVLLTDDMIIANPPCLKQMSDAFADTGGSIVAVETVDADQVQRYGVLNPGAQNGNLLEIQGLVEKPAPEHAPSNLAVIGRYILQPQIFDYLGSQPPGAGGEIQLTDAMNRHLQAAKYFGLEFHGKRYDCGHKAGYVAATIAVAQQDPEITIEQ